MPKLTVVRRENVAPFDVVSLNTDHRLEFGDGELTAVYPNHADESEYRVATFPVEDGGVELPENSVVLSADSSVTALVPLSAYEGGEA